MSILIKSMEMPETCEDCNLESFCDKWISARKMCGEWKLGVKATIRHTDCPLIPVPPHGRLIDADALIKELTLDDEDGKTGATLLMAVFLEVLKAAPTIIPAEEGEA